ncbi:hypothetical protein L7F22_033858 [Adiantum nelumboides]|nr:hypothetical protein [Adiantum nelumboides]
MLPSIDGVGCYVLYCRPSVVFLIGRGEAAAGLLQPAQKERAEPWRREGALTGDPCQSQAKKGRIPALCCLLQPAREKEEGCSGRPWQWQKRALCYLLQPEGEEVE